MIILLPDGKGINLFPIEKSLIKYRVVGSNFVLKDILLLKWGGFERKKTYTHLWEKTYFRLPYEDATHQYTRVQRTDFGGNQTYKVLGYRLFA